MTWECDLSSASLVVYDRLASNVVATIGASTVVDSVVQQDLNQAGPNRAHFEAMLQLDHATQQYTAWVEQGSSAACTLRDQADVLAERAAHFTLEEGVGMHTSFPARAQVVAETFDREPRLRRAG